MTRPLLRTAVLAAAAFVALSWCAPAARAQAPARKVIQSKHFALTYKPAETTDEYAKFVLEACETSLTRLTGTLGYTMPDYLKKKKVRVTIGTIHDKNGNPKPNVRGRAWASLYVATGKPARGFMEVNLEKVFQKGGSTDWHRVRATTGHEVYHLVQNGYDAKEPAWLKESTARFMEWHTWPKEAPKSPPSYGFGQVMRWWNNKRDLDSLTDGGMKYAAAVFWQHLSENHGDGVAVARKTWDAAAVVKGDNWHAALAGVLGDKTEWGPKVQQAVDTWAVADLVRTSKRSPAGKWDYDLATNGPMPSQPYTARARSFAGLRVNGTTASTWNWKVPFFGFRRVELTWSNRAHVGPGEVDVQVQARRVAAGSPRFHAVHAPAAGRWSVHPLPDAGTNKWTSVIVPGVDVAAGDRVFLVASAADPSERAESRYYFNHAILTPPVVEKIVVSGASTARDGVRSRRVEQPDGTFLHRQLPTPRWTFTRSRNAGGTRVTWKGGGARGQGLEILPNYGFTVEVHFSRPMMGVPTVHVGSLQRNMTMTPWSGGRVFTADFTAAEAARLLPAGTDRADVVVRVEGSDRLGAGLDGNPRTAPEWNALGAANNTDISKITRWEGGTGGLPGGDDRLDGVKMPVIRPDGAPQLVRVEMSRPIPNRAGSEVFLDTGRDRMRPVTPGTVTLTLTFDRVMDTTKPPTIGILGGLEVKGSWSVGNRWTGTFTVPDHDAGFSALAGRRTLSVQATSREGFPMDGDPGTSGDQPDTSTRFLVDLVPVFVDRVEVFGKGDRFYEASWQGPRAADPEMNLHPDAQVWTRSLHVELSKDLPAEGPGTMFISIGLSRPCPNPPTVSIAGVPVGDVTTEGDGSLWIGKFDLADLRRVHEPGTALPVEISLTDRRSRHLDADPTTMVMIERYGHGDTWRLLEKDQNSPSHTNGGPDRWHELGAAPKSSFVIVLDASGSMGEEGRMTKAKDAIRGLLDAAPPGVEIGLVTFSGCGGVRTMGFTRDLGAVRRAVDAISPDSGTPLADALDAARLLLVNRAHSSSRDWRFQVFSDGNETCQGDVVAAKRRLNDAIAARRKARPKPPAPKPAPQVQCKPDRWRSWRLEVRPHASGLNDVILVETRFDERAAGSGCRLTLEVVRHPVSYWSYVNDAGERTTRWRVTRPSGLPQRRTATDADGPAAVEALRRQAADLRGRGTDDRNSLRDDIQAAVDAALEGR